MGRGIVCQESEEPRKRSRLWHTKDSFEVLTKKNGTEAIEGLILNMREYHEYTPQISNEVILETKAFERMHKLRLLQLSHVQLKGYYEGFLTELRWLCWNEFPFHSLPNDFPLGCLVVLEMCYSNLREVWQGAKYFPSLKILDLSHSHGELIVNGCTSLETVTFQSVPTLPRIILDESICNLVELEYYFKLQPLERVDEEMIIILDLGMYWKSMETIMMDTIHVFKIGRKKKQPIQGLYEYGIFSTFLPGNKVPGRFAYISRRSRISFTVPLRPQISGLNIFSVYATDNIDITSSASSYSSTVPIVTIVRNKSKKLQWIYAPSFFGTTGDDGKDVIWLSHWKSGNQLEGGDEVTVSVSTTRSPDLEVKMFGVQIVYNEQEDRMKNVYSSFLEAQSQTFNRSPFSPFEISTGNFSSSDGIMEESYSTYYLHCRPEGLRNPELERLQWFHDLTSGFHERSIVYWEDDDRTPPDGPEYMNSSPRARGCPVRVKYFFFSLPLVRGCLRSVDRLRYGRGISIARARLLARWRDCYQGCCGC
ncbi:hypothetical protein M0R45_010022 [Rubus argutus]|uniref:Uncharacterized protein n=1 Tax=Rubus argutus TaxID=59490 RepID=A0AAW1Y652_RUBAR